MDCMMPRMLAAQTRRLDNSWDSSKGDSFAATAYAARIARNPRIMEVMAIRLAWDMGMGWLALTVDG